MEYDQPLDTGYQSELTVTSDIRENLMTMSKWAKFLAILGFVVTGFVVIAAFFVGTIMSTFGGFGGGAAMLGAGFTGMMTIIYLAIGAFYFFLSLYLYRFATNMQTALQNSNQQSFSDAIANHKSYYKLIGVLAAVVLGFYALIFVFALIGGLFAAF